LLVGSLNAILLQKKSPFVNFCQNNFRHRNALFFSDEMGHSVRIAKVDGIPPLKQ
jgi:hypothetical protein